VDNAGHHRRPDGIRPFWSLASAAPAALKAVTRSAMEGTSGTADPGLLRGRTEDAALGPGGVRASDVFASVSLRKRLVVGLRAPTLRGGGARVVGSSRVSLPHGSGASQRRSLQPAVQRSHDERCPSGSGWGKPSLAAPARVPRRRAVRAAKAARLPWPVKPRPVTPSASGGASAPHRTTRRRCPCRTQGFSVLAPPSGAQAVVRSCSRIVAVAEVDERRLVQVVRPGSSLWLPRSRVRAPGAKGRRKPVRGGESHEHASSESGGGLLVIPRADAQASACSGEGALGDGRRPGPVKANVFDETAAEPGRRSRRRGCGSDAGSAIRRGR